MPTRTRIVITAIAVLAAIFVLVPLAVSGYKSANRPPVVITIPAQTAASSPIAVEDSSADTIYVHVAGAVKHPDVYKVPMGARVFDAVRVAGGALGTADEDEVNLAEPLHDGEKVYIPRKGEDLSVGEAAGNGNTIGLMPSAAPADAGKAAKTSGRSGGKPSKLKNPAQGQIDINTAGLDDLERLPGVGPAMAQRILSARQRYGSFRTIGDLEDVQGIGPKKYAKMKPFVKT